MINIDIWDLEFVLGLHGPVRGTLLIFMTILTAVMCHQILNSKQTLVNRPKYKQASQMINIDIRPRICHYQGAKVSSDLTRFQSGELGTFTLDSQAAGL